MDNGPPDNVTKHQTRDLSLSQLLHSRSVLSSVALTDHRSSVSPDIELFSLDQFQSYFCEPKDVLSSVRRKHFLQPRQTPSAPSDPPKKPQSPKLKLPSVDLEGDPQDVEKDLAIQNWWKQKRKQIKIHKAMQKEEAQSKKPSRWPTEKHGRRQIIIFENMTPVDMINEALTIISCLDPESERVPPRFVILLAELERIRRIQQEKVELQNRLLKKRSSASSSFIRHRYDWNQPHMDRPHRVQHRKLTQKPPKQKLCLSWNHTIYVNVAHLRRPKIRSHCHCVFDSDSKELTFTPTISRPPRGYKPKLEIWSRLYNHARQMLRRRHEHQEKRRKQLQEQEVEGCTFTPSLPSSARRGSSDVDVIQRLHSIDLERRKTAWNELIRKTNEELASIHTFKPKMYRHLPVPKRSDSQSKRNPDGVVSLRPQFQSFLEDKAPEADTRLHRDSRSCLI